MHLAAAPRLAAWLRKRLPQRCALGAQLGHRHVCAGRSRLHLDGRDRSVVGLLENPRDLGDEFALVAPRHADPPRSVTILARASRQQAAALPAAVQAQWESRPKCHATLICLTPGQSEQATAAAGVLGLTTVALLLVSLIDAAGFVVVAQRRLRQLGMLAAVGATERHLRLVLLANGAVWAPSPP